MSAPGAARLGVFRELPEDDYHADPTSVSHSGLRLLMDSPSLFRWRQDHPEPRSARRATLDFGSAAHAKVLGTGWPIRVIPVDDKRGNKWSVPAAEAEAEGAIPVTLREAAVVDAMAAKLQEHPLAAKLLSAGEAELSLFWQDDRWEVVRRARLDWIHGRVAVDYKTTNDAAPRRFRWSCRDYGYDSQAAYYLDTAAGLGLDVVRFVHIAQEKEAPYRVSVVELDDASLAQGRMWCDVALERYRDCRDADLWPGFESTEPHLITVPPRRED